MDNWIKRVEKYKQNIIELDNIQMNESIEYSILYDDYKPTEKEVNDMAKELFKLKGLIFKE